MTPPIRNRAWLTASKKWLLLALIAWSQIAFAAHPLSHEAEELGSVCAVCVHAERSAEVAPSSEYDFWIRQELPTLPAEAAPSAPAEPFRLYQSRASP